MKQWLSAIVCIVMLLSVCAVQAFAFDVDPYFQVDGENVSSLSRAFAKVSDAGSVIRQVGGNQSVYLAEENIEITTDVTLITGKVSDTTFRRIEYSGNYLPLFTVKSGGKLTLQCSEIRLIDTDVAGNGKLIVVEQGGTLVLDGTDDDPVTFLDSSDSSGLILVQNGGLILLYGATFQGNQSDGNIKVNDGGAVIGDLNGDRVINGADFCRMCKYLASPETAPTAVFPDFNLDGNANRLDVALLLDYLAKRAPDPDAVDLSNTETYRARVTPDKSVFFRFTPKENAACTFVLPGTENTNLWYLLYDENGNPIDADCYTGSNERISENGTFEITSDFVAGTEYYFEIGTAADDEIDFDLNNPLARSESGSLAASVFSKGNLGIIAAVAVLALAGVAALVIVKKKKKPALADGAEKQAEK